MAMAGMTTYELEAHLGDGDFQKYNSNAGFVEDGGSGNKIFSDIAQAFSHFSFDVS